jgi:hypothetical protein
MNRVQRAAAIRAQILQATAPGTLDHHCHECAASYMFAGLVEAIELRRARGHGTDPETLALIAAVELLERRPAPGVH